MRVGERCFLSLLLLVVVLLPVSASSGGSTLFTPPSSVHPRHSSTTTLEYHVRDEAISVLANSAVPSLNPKLFVFDPKVSVGKVLSSKFPKSLLRRSNLAAHSAPDLCSITKNDQVASADDSLVSLLSSGAEVELRCSVSRSGSKLLHGATSVKYEFRSFPQLFPATQKDDQKLEDTVHEVQAMVEKDPSLVANAPEPEHDFHSLIQQTATVTGHLAEANTFQPPELATPEVSAKYPYQSIDYADAARWVVEAAEAAKLTGSIRKYPTWKSYGLTGRFDASTGALLRKGQRPSKQTGPLHMTLAADWASGTVESDYVGQLMAREDGVPHWTLHAGDVYWTGHANNIRQTCLGQPQVLPRKSERGVSWPHGSVGSIAVLGNHEMYNRGDAFFDLYMPTLGSKSQKQLAGYASVETEYWRVLMLDTGFGSYLKWGGNQPPEKTDMPPELYQWLVEEIGTQDDNDKRGILVITHHQPNTAFASPFTKPAAGLADRLPQGKTFFWLFGHEHKLSFYDTSSACGQSRCAKYIGRCIGNGGFPTNIVPNPGAPNPPSSGKLLGYDTRLYQNLKVAVDPQSKAGDKGIAKAFNGWVDLVFDGPRLKVKYKTLKLQNGWATNTASTTFATETLTVNPTTGDVEFAEKLRFSSGTGATVVEDVRIANENTQNSVAGRTFFNRAKSALTAEAQYAKDVFKSGVAAVKSKFGGNQQVV